MEMATCAFCGRPIEVAFAVTVVLYPPSVDEKSQTLYCHGACLAERLHSSIPLHPSCDDAYIRPLEALAHTSSRDLGL
jgi:hypothetical protein